jgi:hypothetical protein
MICYQSRHIPIVQGITKNLVLNKDAIKAPLRAQ